MLLIQYSMSLNFLVFKISEIKDNIKLNTCIHKCTEIRLKSAKVIRIIIIMMIIIIVTIKKDAIR